ncbi:hypothetical protein V2J09_012273 [Rumex salicifolius]
MTYSLINEEYFELKKLRNCYIKMVVVKNFPSMSQPDQSLISHGLNKMIQENEICVDFSLSEEERQPEVDTYCRQRFLIGGYDFFCVVEQSFAALII